MQFEEFKIIEAKNRRQALDWGLVLASQNIDAVIERSKETGKYILIVSESDFPRAVEQLRLYQAENAEFRQPYQIEIAKNIFDGRSLVWALVMISIYAIDSSSKIDIRSAGIMHKNAVLLGEWWRLFTAVTLHNDIPHLATNVSTGIILLGIAMVYYGAGLSILLAFLAGVFGNVCGLFFHSGDYYGLGASGMVMGALGLLASSGWLSPHFEGSKKLTILRRLIAAIMLFILVGTNPQSDIQAHLGGFFFGLFSGILTVKILKRPSLYYPLNSIAAIIAIALFLFVWWRALR